MAQTTEELSKERSYLDTEKRERSAEFRQYSEYKTK